METLDEIVDFLTLYFRMRNVQNWEYCGYKCFKSLIIYIIGIKDTDMLRTIFDKMIKHGYFIKRKLGSATDYKFVINPAT